MMRMRCLTFDAACPVRMLLATVLLCLAIGAPVMADDVGQKKLACSLCDGLAAEMTGEPEQPFVFRSFEPANGGSALHPALENTGFTYDNALAMMALYGCQRKAEARRVADALVVALETDRHYHDGRLRNAYRSGPVIPGKEGMLLPGILEHRQQLLDRGRLPGRNRDRQHGMGRTGTC
jgi:hypothetical protein